MSAAIAAAVVGGFRRMTLPLAWYYAITLALPLANGAAQVGDAFVEHALAVLAVPPILISLACVTRVLFRLWRARSSANRRECASSAPLGRSILEISSSRNRP
jgi:hypothetical protein